MSNTNIYVTFAWRRADAYTIPRTIVGDLHAYGACVHPCPLCARTGRYDGKYMPGC